MKNLNQSNIIGLYQEIVSEEFLRQRICNPVVTLAEEQLQSSKGLTLTIIKSLIIKHKS